MKENCNPSCDTCNKPSPVLFTESIGYTGALLDKAGWIYKNAILFTGKNTPLCFCSTECQKKYYDEVLKVSPEKSKEIKEWSQKCKEEFKKDIPVIAEKMARIKELLLKIKKG